MIRNTRQREAILNILHASGRSLSPAEIHAAASVYVPHLSLPTVYRQIKGLIDEEAVLQVDIPGQSPRYETPCAQDASDVGHHHHHFRCNICQGVYPIHACPGPMTGLAPKGFRVEGHELTLHGRCASCNAKG